MYQSFRAYLRTFLGWLQRRTGIDVLYVARGGFWTSLAIGISIVTSTLLALAFANFLPKGIYGTYKYVMSLAGSFSFLTLTGVNTAMTRMAATGHDNILSHGIRLQLRYNVAYSIVALGTAVYYFLQDNVTIGVAIFILGIIFPLITTFNTYGAILSGKKEFKRAAWYSSLTSIFYAAVMIATVWSTHNIILLVAAYALGNVVPVLIFHRTTLKTLPPQHASPEEQQELLHYSRHLSIVNIFSTISQYVDKIVLFHFFGSVQLAVYTIAQAMPERIRGYSKGINGFLLPRLSERSLPEIRSVFYLRVLQSALVGLAISIAYVFLAPVVFHVLLPQYLESIHYSQVLIFSFVFTLPASYMGSVFRAQKMIRTIYVSSISANIARIILFVILGKMYGIWGLIGAAIGVYAVGTLLNFILWEYDLDSRGAIPVRDEDKEALSEETRPPLAE